MIIIKTQRERLLEPLQSVIGIVERRHTLPILSNVLIHSVGKEVAFTATDLEVQIRARTQLEEAGEAQAVTLPARKLYDILRSLPNEAAVALETKENRLTVKAGKSRFSLQTLPGQDFPTVAPSTEKGVVVLKLAQKTLKELLERVQYAMAQQDVRYYLNGTLLNVSGTQLTLVATDGHRLSYTTENLQDQHDRAEIILPRKTVSELIKLLAPTDEPVKITLRTNQAEFVFGHIELLSKVIDGKFPDFTRVIPTQYGKHLTLNRMDLLQALQRASILSNDKIHGVRLLLSKNNLAVVCTNNEQEEAQEDLDVQYSQEAIDIGFNITYLMDVMNHLTSETVVYSFGDANSSVLITVPGAEDHFKYVVMPMRI
ncbi:MAG: DNA polymerase III subunit beta [Betaproteobacteria bacterium]|nr:DNA polymerase III subunit beta [Betaproteobacteria bacterium]